MQQFNNPLLKVFIFTHAVYRQAIVRVFVHCEDEITAEWRKFHSEEHHIVVLIKVITEMTMG